MHFPTTEHRTPDAHAPENPLTRYGWDEGFAADFAPYSARGLVPARVVRVDRGRCEVATADGGGTATVTASFGAVSTHDPLRRVCTGDWAALDPRPAGGAGASVEALLPRRTAFVRSASSKRSDAQVMAANADLAAVAVSLSDDPDTGRLERFLALAWESGAQPLLVLTKSDLVADAHHLVADAAEAAPGVPVFAVSSETGEGLDVLTAALAGSTAVLIGRSGAGKSTLVNALVGEEVQQVQAIRDADGKGRHTTTRRELLLLPGGGALIDTPGLRGVGLWEAGAGVEQVFSEIGELAGDCRFHDCGHVAEPGCAVLAAVEEGVLPQRRLDSYRKLLRENARIAARTDARLRAEQRRVWKQRTALGREIQERKRGGAPRRER
ncbi:ribosome small subunit-dependent GTPase A [Streptomyces sp. SCUT-3]|uniref:ribosome small subunit-dependent GTPase A n=1 Tax=Streptomyces TaxID=1883 RepID=UPI0015FA93EA|nr:ribosome small subunit-dependent GTPase A [Streptomyces sp. SCUT-3]QMV21329.1 ribosome small subunit-dependent GTPase A [Streptomyces sp. SCUT-3]